MSFYRLYTLDSEGHIASAAHEFQAISDEEAVEQALARRSDATLELWRRQCRLLVVPPAQSTSGARAQGDVQP